MWHNVLIMQNSSEDQPQEIHQGPLSTHPGVPVETLSEVAKKPSKVRLPIIIVGALVVAAVALVINYFFVNPLPDNGPSPSAFMPSSNCTLQMFKSSEIEVSPWTDLNNLTKSQILDGRKAAVAKYFAQTGASCKEGEYQPSKYVYDQIEEGKPWIGKDGICSSSDPFGTELIISGESEESAYLNNPLTLLAHETLFYQRDDCGEDQFFEIESFNYDSVNRKFTLTYVTPRLIDNAFLSSQPITQLLDGTNAVDLGYPYINISATINANTTDAHDEVYQMTNYIHLGDSCQFPGGCNNGSPYQNFMEFTVTGLPATISAKLWHDAPSSPQKEADYYFDVVFLSRDS